MICITKLSRLHRLINIHIKMEVLQVHQTTHSPPSTLHIISQSFNVVNHVVIGLVAIYMTWISIRADAKPMTWHAWSCTIGVSFTTLSSRQRLSL